MLDGYLHFYYKPSPLSGFTERERATSILNIKRVPFEWIVAGRQYDISFN